MPLEFIHSNKLKCPYCGSHNFVFNTETKGYECLNTQCEAKFLNIECIINRGKLP